MKQISLKRLFLATAVVALGVAGSIDWSVNDGLSLSIDRAQARVGRPATPGSVAGVARRTTRRAVVGGAAVGGAVVVAPACVRVLVNGAMSAAKENETSRNRNVRLERGGWPRF